jgi:hypothetical protein
MVQLKMPAGATTGGAAAPVLATLVPAATIQALLQTESIAPGRGRTGVEAAKASVVRVICVRN